jgi:putative acetyltransferase
MVIREERDGDRDGIRELNRRAFETEAEARLVDRLRDEGAVQASLVALEGDHIVGHALYSAGAIEYESNTLAIGALGPVAVLPEWQRRGAGSAVSREGIGRCWALDLPAIIVLGHPAYYAKFGFVRADRWEIRCEFDAPVEAFMVLWSAAAIHGPAVARYHPAFFDA